MSDALQVQPRYRPALGLLDTERGIKLIKDVFERRLADVLRLQRVSAPKFLEAGDGLQDDLAGTQVPVQFRVRHSERPIEIVHSLAKWKRRALARYGIGEGQGLYTDMDAIRKDEQVDDIHSNYVDQWDWEKVLHREDRNLDYLRRTVEAIYGVLLDTEAAVHEAFPRLPRRLPPAIAFLHAQELEDRYPQLSPRDREDRAAAEHGAFFLVGIGGKLRSGQEHDLRAADYDDWSTETSPGRRGLNGDIIVHDPVRGRALELSSMGIRVDEAALVCQLKEMGLEDRLRLEFHRGILSGEYPLTIGGGIGQSRLCMLLLQKAHVGEVQVSVWPEAMRRDCERQGILFL